MKIVIDISENQYEMAKEFIRTVDDQSPLAKAVANGILLPEHYGRLIDADALYKMFKGRCAGRCDICALWTVEGCQHLKDAPTIIPATKEGESE